VDIGPHVGERNPEIQRPRATSAGFVSLFEINPEAVPPAAGRLPDFSRYAHTIRISSVRPLRIPDFTRMSRDQEEPIAAIVSRQYGVGTRRSQSARSDGRHPTGAPRPRRVQALAAGRVPGPSGLYTPV